MDLTFTPSRLAQLKAAMCSATMTEILGRDWVYPERRGLSVRDCQAVRVYPRENNRFVLEYQVRFRDKTGDRVERVIGELVGDTAQEHCRRVIERLRKHRRGQLPRDEPTDLVAALPTLGLVLRFAGLDERLIGLKVAYDPAAIAPVLSRHLPINGGAEEGRVKVLNHRLGKRCVLRYRLGEASPEADQTRARSAIVKVYEARSGLGGQVFSVMRNLKENGFGHGAKDGIRIPTPLAYLPEWKLLLMEDVPGSTPAHPDLQGMEAAGWALAKLHRCSLEVPMRHSVDDEVALLGGWVAVIPQVYPELKEGLEEAFAIVRAGLRKCRDGGPTLVHRDYHEKTSTPSAVPTRRSTWGISLLIRSWRSCKDWATRGGWKRRFLTGTACWHRPVFSTGSRRTPIRPCCGLPVSTRSGRGGAILPIRFWAKSDEPGDDVSSGPRPSGTRDRARSGIDARRLPERTAPASRQGL
jgi:hypothetical protein